MALAIATAPWLQIAALYLHAVISLPYVSNFYCDEHAYRIEAPALLRPWQSGSGVDYLQGEDGFIGAKLLERLTPRDAVIYTTYGIAKSYCDRHVLGAGQSSLARVLQDVLLRASGDVTTLVSLNCEFSNGVDDIQVVAETDVPMPLSVSEIALFGSASGQRFPVTVRPSINPWYGPFLSDRMLVTHWASWANVRRVSFSAHRAGTVRVVLSFAGEDMSGKWSVLGNREGVAQSSATCVSKSEPFSANLGPEAILAVRKMGVTHILLKKDDWFSHFFEPVVRLNSRLLADENSWVLFSLPALTGENSVRPPAALGL